MKTHSLPHFSNDNPFSEAQLKALNNPPDYPSRLDCQPDACLGKYILRLVQPGTFPQRFGFADPGEVHYDRTQAVHQKR
jgi:putative transposase